MAGKHGGSKVWFLAGGYNLISPKLQDLSGKIENLQQATHGLGDSWEESTPTGVRKGTVTQSGAFFDTTASTGLHAMLSPTVPALDPQTASRVVAFGFAGSVIGEPFYGVQGDHIDQYEVLATVGSLQRANVNHVVTGAIESGVILHALTQETADANTEATDVDHTVETTNRVVPITSSAAAGDIITCGSAHGLSVNDTVLISGHSGSTPSINGIQTVATVPSTTTFSISTDITVGGTGGSFLQAKSNLGGSAYLEATALALGGHTGALVTIRHSDDGSTYVDLVAFTTLTSAPAAQRVTVAGAVRRWLAQSIDFQGAGSPTCTYMAGFCRN